ncbi:hypothetical protein BJX65DRAFT_304131 [Aspergillus insuetus]
MNGHQILAVLELIIYGTLMGPVTFCTFHYLFKKQTAWLYLHAFVIAKIAGPAIYLSIATKRNPSRDLQMASQILYSIALGPLLSATLSFVNSSPSSEAKYSHHHDSQQQRPNDDGLPTAYQPSYTPLNLSPGIMRPKPQSVWLTTFLRLLHPLIVVALVLGIISGIDRTPSADGTLEDMDKYDRGATFAKASGALFLLALVGISIGVAFMFRRRKTLPTVASYIITAMPLIIPLLFLRVLYSVLGAANLDTQGHRGHTTRYNVLTGSWAVYLVLGLIPQGVVLVVYTGCGVGAWWKERRGLGAGMRY